MSDAHARRGRAYIGAVTSLRAARRAPGMRLETDSARSHEVIQVDEQEQHGHADGAEGQHIAHIVPGRAGARFLRRFHDMIVLDLRPDRLSPASIPCRETNASGGHTFRNSTFGVDLRERAGHPGNRAGMTEDRRRSSGSHGFARAAAQQQAARDGRSQTQLWSMRHLYLSSVTLSIRS